MTASRARSSGASAEDVAPLMLAMRGRGIGRGLPAESQWRALERPGENGSLLHPPPRVEKMKVHKTIQLLGAICAGVSMAASQPPAQAQATTLPKASRTVFKCSVGGKITYTDEPCAGAQRIDVEPTRGLNKSTGTELTGADVSRERSRETLAEAIKPLTGLTPRQLDVRRNRVPLSAEATAECATLDASIARLEAEERTLGADKRSAVQHSLLAVRKRLRELRC